MGTTPAAHLARLKVTYQGWSIRAIEPERAPDTPLSAEPSGEYGRSTRRH
jgi:hypothetical protein